MYRLNLKPARLAAALLFCLALPAAAYNSREVESISSRLDLLEEEPLQKSTEAALIQQLDEINGYISRLADCEETARSELNKLKDIKNLPAGLKEQQKTHTGQMLACQSLQKRAIDLRRSFGLAIDRHSFKRY